MAAPSHDGSAHGAPSIEHAHAVPARPEGTRQRPTAFSPPGALDVDETVPTAHRVRRDRTMHLSAATEQRMGFVVSTALAIVSLVFVLAVALGSMLVSAAILHAASPDRRFDAFHALHEPLVVALLCGLGVLWLLPPHPWAIDPAQNELKKRRLASVRVAA
jgi:hypothetical protein